jgi:hypothetical protein
MNSGRNALSFAGSYQSDTGESRDIRDFLQELGGNLHALSLRVCGLSESVPPDLVSQTWTRPFEPPAVIPSMALDMLHFSLKDKL